MTTVSLCMIVKNEEKNIERCLASARPFVDEMIVVDTGSTDQTIQLCRAAGAQVYSFEWNNHFAEARNYSLEQATGDWILWMDADEVIDVSAAGNWNEQLAIADVPLFNVHLVNYIGEAPDPNETFHIAHTRLFRNGIGLRFLYPIHETLNVEEILIGEKAPRSIGQIEGLIIYHYGYLQPYVTAKQKNERNLRLLLQEWNTDNSNPWTEYHLASEYYRTGQYEQAFNFVNLSIARFLNSGKLPPSLLYNLKYSCLIIMDSLENIPTGIDKAIKLYPDYINLYFYKGVALFKSKEYSSAIEQFEQCILMGEDNITHLILKGSGSFHPWYYKGKCLEQLQEPKAAAKAYEEALNLYPNYALAQEALAQLVV
ncbi:glycosyltransferase family 2 protein [Bacillus sp. FJAT-27264]|uniref:glycosyltransferase n=1 Tax=Paenibacillus sp. (strain DSM 101736 / FJAT-27264) TaxID=1850362 RepID=UPI000A99CBF6|nr:glycosyltransferase family 2 protein [Bacillus sp. FJAT-27264]